ncbi:MAG: HAD family hydrolase [Treponema sp.]|nr:HAD family hydrolase [Spirochaetia bacterium]MDD7014028.1 HAD family hydrolase [Spirochaetales bacterium]MDY4901314.1 HAD family hydrolase [Treponema sp.]
MTVYKIPEDLKTIIFDIDGTLYTSKEYVFEQVDVQIRYWAKLNGMSEDEARKKINDFRKKWSAEHNGMEISLGNTFPHFGVDIETSIKWRNLLMEPAKFLSRNENLIKVLTELKEKYSLIAVTNNPVDAARRTLKAIGIDSIITDIIGLDTFKKSKPAIEVLEEAVRRTKSSYSQCLSVGDRYDIDLSLPLKLGMGAVLVSGVKEVENLPYVLKAGQ